MNKLVRGIPESVILALSLLAPRKPRPNETKSGQRRPDTNAVCVDTLCLRALGSPLWYQVAEIEDLAFTIATQQRQEDNLQNLDTIRTKLLKEQKELAEVVPEDQYACDNRLASCMYYLSQQFLYDHALTAYQETLTQLSETYQTPIELLFLLCLAKFRERARRKIKSVEYEKAAMREARTKYYEMVEITQN